MNNKNVKLPGSPDDKKEDPKVEDQKVEGAGTEEAKTEATKTEVPEVKEPETSPGKEDPLAEMQKRLDELAEANAKLLEENQNLRTEKEESKTRRFASTGDNVPCFVVGLKGNPTRYVRAESKFEAEEIYEEFYGITASEHAKTCSLCNESDIPDGEQVIFVNEQDQVCSKDKEGNLQIAGQ